VTGYTKVNLHEIEDVARKRDMPDEMSVRFPGGELGTEKASVSLQRYGPNFRQPFGHKHEQQEEIYVIVEGAGKMALDDEVIEVEQWDVIRVAPATMRAFEGGPDGIEFLAIGAPASGAERAREDAAPEPGWWPQ